MAITAAPRPATSSPLNPLTRTRKLLPSTTNTTTHLSNLDRLLQKHSPPPPPHLTHDPGKSDPHDTLPPGNPTAPSNFLHALNLHALFNPPDEMTSMSPRSLRHLKRLLSDTTRLSPRNTIAPNWRQYHGANNWGGLLDPLEENLRRELIRYGDLVQAAYHAFHSNPAVSPDRHRHVILPDRNYRVTRSLYATSSIDLPKWVHGVAPWVTQQSSWIGYVAVCDNEREIQRMGRRDIVIALRGTATYLEWAENFRAGLVPVDDDVSKPGPHVPKVECGFKSLYKTAGAHVPSLAESVRDEVMRLMERYKDEEISITVTGHSLGAALAVLVADELSHVPDVPPIAVFSFGGPRVGNRGFADRVENNGVKVLRVVNANDMVTRVPVGPPLMDGYVDVGQELRVDSRESPYLRANADAACCHDLEAYLHLVDGFLGTHCPFRSNANRSLNRLLNQQGPNVKKVYVATAQSLAMDLLDPSGGARSGVGTCLPSPSH